MGRIDPRLRIVTAVALSMLVAVADRFEVLAAAVVVALLGSVLAGLSPPAVFKRLLPLNVLVLLLAVLLPLTTDGTPALRLGPLAFSREGLLLAAQAGYDPREAVRVWERMSREGGSQPPEFLSTHPSHGTRIAQLKEWMPEALRVYQQATQQAPAQTTTE